MSLQRRRCSLLQTRMAGRAVRLLVLRRVHGNRNRLAVVGQRRAGARAVAAGGRGRRVGWRHNQLGIVDVGGRHIESRRAVGGRNTQGLRSAIVSTDACVCKEENVDFLLCSFFFSFRSPVKDGGSDDVC